jgi:integrase
MNRGHSAHRPWSASHRSIEPRNRRPSGSLVIDRDFTAVGVGRIQLSTGSHDVVRCRYLNGLLTILIRDGTSASATTELEILHALRRGDLTFNQLAQADALGRLKSALADARAAARAVESATGSPAPPDPLTRGLWSTFLDELLPNMDPDAVGSETRRRYATSIEALKRRKVKGLRDNALVRDLLTVNWKTVRVSWGGSAADWNHLRRALSALLTALYGHSGSEIRMRLMKLMRKKKEKPRKPSMTAAQFWNLVANAPEHARAPLVTLVVTALRMGEYLRLRPEHLDAARCEIDVPGTKTDASEATIAVDPRYWPWIIAAVPAPLGYNWIRRYWVRACLSTGLGELLPDPKRRGKRRYAGPRLHDLRHCHGQWATDSGAPEKAVQAMMRHTNPAQTRQYTATGETMPSARAAADALDAGRAAFEQRPLQMHREQAGSASAGGGH